MKVSLFFLTTQTTHHVVQVHQSHQTAPTTPRTQTSQFVLLFEPFHQYGACFTAQEHGYVNTVIFPQQLDMSKGLEFVV